MLMLPVFTLVTKIDTGWVVGCNEVGYVFGRAVQVPAVWTFYIADADRPPVQPLKCVVNDAGCTPFRIPAFGSAYCLNHYSDNA